MSQRFHFEAAHSLNRCPEVVEASVAAGSRRIHGHTYHAEVGVQGRRDARSGMVVDLADLIREVATLRALLDHRLLDDVEGLGAATLENLCAFIWERLEPSCPALVTVMVERRASGDRCTLRRGG